MKKALIELKGISKNFAGVKALQDVDLTIYEGETRCLAGENGCGKSTLLKLLRRDMCQMAGRSLLTEKNIQS